MGSHWSAALAAAMGLLLSACARAPEIPFETLEAKYAGPTSAYMDLPQGLRVHYRDEGRRDGVPIVLVHGFSASLHAWEPWVDKLSGDYRLISLDLPGHGLTRAPADYEVSLDRYAEVVDAAATKLGLGPYVLVGNSMGGGAAWTLALRRPERVRALVLVDAAPPPDKPGGERPGLMMRLAGSAPARAVLRGADLRGIAERGLKSAYLDPRLVTPALVDRYLDLSRAPGHRDILLRGGGRGASGLTLASLAQIRAPTLVMTGEDDRLIPPAAARRMAATIPGARLIAYPGVGHVPMEQIPDRSAQDLKAFLAGVGP